MSIESMSPLGAALFRLAANASAFQAGIDLPFPPEDGRELLEERLRIAAGLEDAEARLAAPDDDAEAQFLQFQAGKP